jgi:hypothetical protein
MNYEFSFSSSFKLKLVLDMKPAKISSEKSSISQSGSRGYVKQEGVCSRCFPLLIGSHCSRSTKALLRFRNVAMSMLC